MGQSIDPLSAEQRIAHYRQMAMEVTRLSGEAHFAEMQAQFLRLAESWLALADEVERKSAECTLHVGPAPTAADATLTV